MIKTIAVRSLLLVALAAVASGIGGCKKDEGSPSGPGTPGIATITFGDTAPAVALSGTSATSVKLAGGTLPYAVTTAADPSVALVALSHDTLTVTPVAAGTTSVTIHDASPQQEETASPKIITITITVTGGSGGGSPFEFPIPDVANINGGVGVIAASSPAFGSYVYGIGAFEELSGFVYAGVVTANNVILDTTRYNDALIYMKDVTAAVSFNNSSTASFSVAGGNGVPSFNASIVPPAASSITAPASGASVAVGANLSVQWSNSGVMSDSVIITIENLATSQTLAKTQIANTGSATITPAELAALGTGGATISVTKYRYNVAAVSTKRYLVLAESSSLIFVTLH